MDGIVPFEIIPPPPRLPSRRRGLPAVGATRSTPRREDDVRLHRALRRRIWLDPRVAVPMAIVTQTVGPAAAGDLSSLAPISRSIRPNSTRAFPPWCHMRSAAPTRFIQERYVPNRIAQLQSKALAEGLDDPTSRPRLRPSMTRRGPS